MSILRKTDIGSLGKVLHVPSRKLIAIDINDTIGMGPMDFNKDNQNIGNVLNRSFILLNLSFFLVFLNISFLYLYPLALDAMGAAHHVIGLVMGIFSAASVLSRPLMGKFVTIKGEYWVISIGMGISLMASLGYLFIISFGPAMLLVRVIHGIGFSAFVSGSFSFAAKTFQPQKSGEEFSFVGASLMAAVALGPPLGEILIEKWNFWSLYMAASGAIIMAWIASYIAIPSLSHSITRDNSKAVRYLPLFKKKSFLFLLVSTLVFAHCQATVPNFLALIAAKKGAASGWFFFDAYMVAILVLVIMGRFIDRHGKLHLMRLSYPLFSFGILAIPFTIQAPTMIIAAVLYGAGLGLLFPTHNALAASHGAKWEKPAVMAVFTAIYDSGFITGAVVSGWFAYQTSLDTLFLACGMLAFLGFMVVVSNVLVPTR